MKYHKDGLVPSAGEVFVFGSNLAGRHGAGAARIAAQYFGMKYGFAAGRCGQAYGIPTKDTDLNVLSIEEIKPYIDEFVRRANKNPEIKYFVTRVGCGLAGYKNFQIAPLFKGCGDNVSFPIEWKEYL
jgi:hypothetical protein